MSLFNLNQCYNLRPPKRVTLNNASRSNSAMFAASSAGPTFEAVGVSTNVGTKRAGTPESASTLRETISTALKIIN